MAEFDKIENLDQLEAWLDTQDMRICRAIATRAALRALPALMDVVDQTFIKTAGSSLLLSGLRMTLRSGCASTCTHPDMQADMQGIQSATSTFTTAAISAIYATSPSTRSAVFSAHCAADFTRHATDSTRAAAVYSADSAASTRAAAVYSAALSATFTDAHHCRNGGPHQIFATPLWPNGEDIAHIQKMWTDFEAHPDPTGIWSFWRDWYRSMLQGRPMDWDLQLQITLIGDGFWQAGPETVAKKIEKIREDFQRSTKEKERHPEFEPKSVAQLIENRVIATASLQGLSVQIADAIEQYHAETGANALPDAFTPLLEMPSLLEAIASSLKRVPDTGQASPDLVQQLREENGRLNAKISELQQELQKLRSLDPKLASKSELGKLFSFLKKTSLVGGLVSGLWVLSGDELGAKQRYENLITDWEFAKGLVQGEVSPPQGLGETQVEKSLHPLARPDRN